MLGSERRSVGISGSRYPWRRAPADCRNAMGQAQHNEAPGGCRGLRLSGWWHAQRQTVELPIQARRSAEGASSRVWFMILPRRMLMRGAAEVVVRRARGVVELVMVFLPVQVGGFTIECVPRTCRRSRLSPCRAPIGRERSRSVLTNRSAGASRRMATPRLYDGRPFVRHGDPYGGALREVSNSVSTLHQFDSRARE